MIVPSVLSSRFEEWKPFILDAQKRVEETLVPYARRQGYIFDGRVKTLESLAEKLESGRYNGWTQIEDLYACTIAIPLPDEESNVREFLIEKFDLISSRERGRTAKQPEVFRFDSTRLILRIRKPEIAPREEDPSVFSVSFEVQIKSLYDYAWAKTTHALTYKSNTVEWKRYRLAAHLKAASEQIEFLLRGFDGASQYLVESPWASIRDKERIGSFFKNSVENGVIPTEVAPKDWSRFSDNIYRGLQALEGHAPTSGGGRELGILEHALEELGRHFCGLSARAFPRSVSLYQYSLGYLSVTLREPKRHDRLNILEVSNLFEVFPDAKSKLPGRLFTLE